MTTIQRTRERLLRLRRRQAVRGRGDGEWADRMHVCNCCSPHALLTTLPSSSTLPPLTHSPPPGFPPPYFSLRRRLREEKLAMGTSALEVHSPSPLLLSPPPHTSSSHLLLSPPPLLSSSHHLLRSSLRCKKCATSSSSPRASCSHSTATGRPPTLHQRWRAPPRRIPGWLCSGQHSVRSAVHSISRQDSLSWRRSPMPRLLACYSYDASHASHAHCLCSLASCCRSPLAAVHLSADGG